MTISLAGSRNLGREPSKGSWALGKVSGYKGVQLPPTRLLRHDGEVADARHDGDDFPRPDLGDDRLLELRREHLSSLAVLLWLLRAPPRELMEAALR